MVDFEKSSPETQPKLVEAQWYGDAGAGVGRGVDPEAARDLGYKDPAEIVHSEPQGGVVAPDADSEPGTSKTSKGRRSPRTRRGLGHKGLLNADGPPPGVDDARKTY